MKKAKHLKDILRSCFGKITLKVVWKVKEVVRVLQRTLPLYINSFCINRFICWFIRLERLRFSNIYSCHDGDTEESVCISDWKASRLKIQEELMCQSEF